MEEAAAIPAEHFAVYQPDRRMWKDGLQFFPVFVPEGIGFRRQEDEVATGGGQSGGIGDRIAGLVDDIDQTAAMEHIVDESAAASGHVREGLAGAPDKVGGAGVPLPMAIALGEGWVNGSERCEITFDLIGQDLCLLCTADDVTEAADHGEGASQIMDIADPNGVPGGEGFDLFSNVLFLVGDDQIGLEFGDFFGANVFGAADPGLRAKPVIGVDAEFGDTDDFGVQPEGIKQFCLRGYQGDDAEGAMDGMVQDNGSTQLVGKGRHGKRLGTQDR